MIVERALLADLSAVVPLLARQLADHDMPQEPDVLAAVHAGLGTVAELLGLYIFVVAGTNILPKRLRFTRYKPWMRTALALWWLVLLLGVATYLRWYVAPLL